MIRRSLTIIGLLIVLWCGCIETKAQNSSRYQIKNDFEIISIEDGNVTTRENCSGFKFVLILVVDSPKLSKERINEVVKNVSDSFPIEYDLILELVSDRSLSSTQMTVQFETEWARSLRAIYFRTRDNDKLFIFRTGTTPDELRRLIP